MEKGYTAFIDQTREDCIEIFIWHDREPTGREFDIKISKDGLKITIDGTLSVRPRAANQIELDYL